MIAPTNAPPLLKLLAHDLRWRLLGFLTRSDYAVHELVGLLEQPPNLVSYHLRQLAQQGIVQERHSDADERSIYYSLDVARLQQMYFRAASDLHPALGPEPRPDARPQPKRTPPVRVLFLCTHNSARSQMAEALLRELSHGAIEVASAGSQPAEQIHPEALQALAALNIDASQQRPKSLEQFQNQSFDYVITLCDRVREACTVFPERQETIHWSFPDPAVVEGSKEDRYRAFEQTALQLGRRIQLFLITVERTR
jgi:protein-tyrosine-phosphatase